jgi:hypothetical protein
MFISCEFHGKILNSKNPYVFEYDLIDTDFEQKIEGHGIIGRWVIDALIDVYEARNSNVAANIVRAYLWYNKTYVYQLNTTIDIYNNGLITKSERLLKYENDLQKYLVLL